MRGNFSAQRLFAHDLNPPECRFDSHFKISRHSKISRLIKLIRTSQQDQAALIFVYETNANFSYLNIVQNFSFTNFAVNP